MDVASDGEEEEEMPEESEEEEMNADSEQEESGENEGSDAADDDDDVTVWEAVIGAALQGSQADLKLRLTHFRSFTRLMVHSMTTTATSCRWTSLTSMLPSHILGSIAPA